MNIKKHNMKGAGRKCSICKDENLKEINEMIESGETSFRNISCHFFDSISKRDAIRRHAGSCLIEQGVILESVHNGTKSALISACLSDKRTAQIAQPLKKRTKEANVEKSGTQPDRQKMASVPAAMPHFPLAKYRTNLNIFQRIKMKRRISRLCADYRK